MDDRLRELLAINRAIASTLDYEELLLLIVDKTVELTSADACALLLSGNDGVATVAASRGIDPEVARAFRAPFNERISGELRRLLGHDGHDTFLGVPVISRGSVTGMLAARRREPSRDDPEEEAIVTALGDQAAIALDHASRYRELYVESQRSREQLQAEAARKDQFLAMLAHELRNPLAAIVSALAIFDLRLPDVPLLRRTQQTANRQALHMKRLLDDLLDVSRVTTGKISLDLKPVAIRQIVGQAVQMAQPLAEERGHEVRVRAPDEALIVQGDHDRLVQVFSNLLVNAAKYSDDRGLLEVEITAQPSEITVSVRDRGRGIAPDLLPRVFDLFVQAERPANRPEGGLGIGLTLVRELVQLHGGRVEAQSEGPGRGTEMIVHLPRSAASVSHGVVPERVSATAPQRRRVLLVEDDADVAEMLGVLLESEGHRVTVVGDGEAALVRIAGEAPDVMVVDIGLPGMDGYELAREVHARIDHPPLLVAVTGYGQPQDRARSREAGFDHHLVKPVKPEQLRRVLA